MSTSTFVIGSVIPSATKVAIEKMMENRSFIELVKDELEDNYFGIEIVEDKFFGDIHSLTAHMSICPMLKDTPEYMHFVLYPWKGYEISGAIEGYTNPLIIENKKEAFKYAKKMIKAAYDDQVYWADRFNKRS